MPPSIPHRAASFQSLPSVYTHCSSCLRREFSSTPASKTRLRRQMFAWLNGAGDNFRHPLPNSTNYLSAYDRRGSLLRQGDTKQNPSEDTPDTIALQDAAEGKALAQENRDDLKPFPLNNYFISESVLSEPLRNEIWKRVIMDKKSVRTVSVEMGVEMRRVGAVVRLVELEKRMRQEGQSLALPYARAVHGMVPTTPFEPGNITPHEPINDLPVHPLTRQQVFYPTSESRAFNRTDAGRVFSAAPRLPDEQDVGQGGRPAFEPWQNTKVEHVGKGEDEISVLKPADARIPHSHLIAFEQDKRDPALRQNRQEISSRYAKRLIEDAEKREAARVKKMEEKESSKTRVESDRWQFVVTNVKSGTQGSGFRYGVPHEDRKKAHVKIPTKVEV